MNRAGRTTLTLYISIGAVVSLLWKVPNSRLIMKLHANREPLFIWPGPVSLLMIDLL